jgi:hypothetical protein
MDVRIAQRALGEHGRQELDGADRRRDQLTADDRRPVDVVIEQQIAHGAGVDVAADRNEVAHRRLVHGAQQAAARRNVAVPRVHAEALRGIFRHAVARGHDGLLRHDVPACS